MAGLVGALTAFAVFSAFEEPGGTDAEDAGLIYGGFTFAAGAMVGALFPQERWKRIQLGP